MIGYNTYSSYLGHFDKSTASGYKIIIELFWECMTTTCVPRITLISGNYFYYAEHKIKYAPSKFSFSSENGNMPRKTARL